MSQNSWVVRVGVGVFVLQSGKILFGKRKGSHGAGAYAPPGGHLEVWESFEACASREVAEETGLPLKNIRFVALTNDIFTNEDKHYITIFMAGEIDGDYTPQLLEPNKCEGWEWFAPENLPAPLFLSCENLIKQGFPKLF